MDAAAGEVGCVYGNGVGEQMLGSRREFSPFVNQLGKMAYGLTIYIVQSIYESTSSYMNAGTLGDMIG